MIVIIVRAVGKHYTRVLYQVTERKEADGTKMTPDDLCDAVGKAWEIGGSSNDAYDDSNDSVSDTALTSINDIKCYNCGQLGHKTNKCPKQKSSGTGRFICNSFLSKNQGPRKDKC